MIAVRAVAILIAKIFSSFRVLPSGSTYEGNAEAHNLTSSSV
jgi:hypothetical protein